MGFRIATVQIRNKHTGKKKVVNAHEYPNIMAHSGAWELVKEQFAGATNVKAQQVIEPEKPSETTVAETESVVEQPVEETAAEETSEESVDSQEASGTEEEGSEAETDTSEEVTPKRRGRKTKAE